MELPGGDSVTFVRMVCGRARDSLDQALQIYELLWLRGIVSNNSSHWSLLSRAERATYNSSFVFSGCPTVAINLFALTWMWYNNYVKNAD